MFPMQTMKPNMLVLYLQPDEGVHWRFEAKAPDTVNETRSVDMEFHYSDSFGNRRFPNPTRDFCSMPFKGMLRSSPAQMKWKPPGEAWKSTTQPLAAYDTGSWGPAKADALLARDGRIWCMVDGKSSNEN
jgi:glucose-6-phosphate 1-dehydrogenase